MYHRCMFACNSMYNLYARWHKNEIAEEYHSKYLFTYQNKNIFLRNV